jgi:hypothetical protein
VERTTYKQRLTNSLAARLGVGVLSFGMEAGRGAYPIKEVFQAARPR